MAESLVPCPLGRWGSSAMPRATSSSATPAWYVVYSVPYCLPLLLTPFFNYSSTFVPNYSSTFLQLFFYAPTPHSLTCARVPSPPLAQGLAMVEAGTQRVVSLAARVTPDSPTDPGSYIRYANTLDISPTTGGCHAMSCHVIPCHVMSCHVTPCHVTQCHVMSRIPRHIHSLHCTQGLGWG